MDADDKYEDISRKKRVAYDSAEQSRPKPTKAAAPNHSKASMQMVFMRQVAARQQLEQMEQKKQDEANAETKRIAKLQAEWQAKMSPAAAAAAVPEKPKSKQSSSQLPTPAAKLTPLMSPALASYQPRLSNPRITPISNLAAIQKAKAKVDQMRAEKMQTVPKTVPKMGAGRVAHVNKTLIEVGLKHKIKLTFI